jgi:hypothetical protein
VGTEIIDWQYLLHAPAPFWELVIPQIIFKQEGKIPLIIDAHIISSMD